MHIKIGDINTLSVSDWKVITDDRQEMIEVIGGVVVQDFGYVRAGEKINCRISIWAKDADILRDYFQNRELVDVTDEAGYVWENRRILIKSYSRRSFFPNVFDFEIEIWGK